LDSVSSDGLDSIDLEGRLQARQRCPGRGFTNFPAAHESCPLQLGTSLHTSLKNLGFAKNFLSTSLHTSLKNLGFAKNFLSIHTKDGRNVSTKLIYRMLPSGAFYFAQHKEHNNGQQRRHNEDEVRPTMEKVELDVANHRRDGFPVT
jgi:hypothetical protein